MSSVEKYRNVISRTNLKALEYEDDYGNVIAQGEGVLGVIFDYYESHLGYDLGDLFNDYEWRVWERNPDYMVCELGFVSRVGSGKVITPRLRINPDKTDNRKLPWRVQVKLSHGNFYVSQVVSEVFIGDITQGCVVAHKNDTPIDNRVNNLEYVTQKKNIATKLVRQDVTKRLLNDAMVDYTYSRIQDYFEEVYSIDADFVDEITDEEAEEIQETVDLYGSTIKDIHQLVVKGSGVLATLQVVDGYYYV